MKTPQQRSRTLLAVGAWALLVAIAVGFLTTIPSVDAAIDKASAAISARLLTGLVLFLTGAAALATWVGALWYAAVNHRPGAGRWALFALLGFGNFVASFFYYFGYVYWSRAAAGDPAA